MASHSCTLNTTLTFVPKSAFKFLPVLGKYVADCFEGTASKELRHQWRLIPGDGQQPLAMYGDGSRAGPPLRVLAKEEQAKL